MNQHQLQIIDYLREENRVLRERLGGRRVRFSCVTHSSATLCLPSAEFVPRSSYALRRYLTLKGEQLGTALCADTRHH